MTEKKPIDLELEDDIKLSLKEYNRLIHIMSVINFSRPVIGAIRIIKDSKILRIQPAYALIRKGYGDYRHSYDIPILALKSNENSNIYRQYFKDIIIKKYRSEIQLKNYKEMLDESKITLNLQSIIKLNIRTSGLKIKVQSKCITYIDMVTSKTETESIQLSNVISKLEVEVKELQDKKQKWLDIVEESEK